MNDVTASEGDAHVAFNVEFSKKLSASHKIKCFYKDEPLDLNSDKYSVEIKDFYCTLKIKNVDLKDEGSYTIQVDKAKSSADLVVEGIYNIFTVILL